MMVLKYKMRKCPECGVIFEGHYAGRALAGHLWLKHQQRAGVKAELEGEIAKLKQKYSDLVARFNNLVSENEQLELAQSQAVDEAKKVRRELGTCPLCYKDLGSILYHDKVEAKFEGKGGYVVLKCRV